jgi:mannose-6-phosphate isomerase-like protein (cupin superfamily)
VTTDHHFSDAVSLAAVLEAATGPGPVWTHSSADLNVNLLSFDGGQGVPSHINRDLDVLVVVVAGNGVIEIDGVTRDICAGQVCVIPKGARRAIRSGGGPFAYLTCHRRRAGLWPEGVPRPEQG